MIIGIKYHVPSRGELGKNVIWRIYKNVDKTFAETEYVEHIEIEEVDSWTGENLFRIGYGLILEGEVECFTDPATGLRHARIYASE